MRVTKKKLIIVLLLIIIEVTYIYFLNFNNLKVNISRLEDIDSYKLSTKISKRMNCNIRDLYVNPSSTIFIGFTADGTLDNSIQFTVYNIKNNRKIDRIVHLDKNSKIGKKMSSTVNSSWVTSVDCKESLNLLQYLDALSRISNKKIVKQYYDYFDYKPDHYYIDFGPVSYIPDDDNKLLFIDKEAKINEVDNINSILSDKKVAYFRLTPYNSNSNQYNVINILVEIED